MRQLVFASAPAGLQPGRSGYCTVARSADLGERLVRALEAAGTHEPGEGVAFAFHLLRAGEETCAVITRYADAGPDYTGRASTLAHHLVFSHEEAASLPPPADVARRFTGWIGRWEGAPRILPESAPPLEGSPATLPAQTWKRLAGDAGKAALFCDDTGRAKAGAFPAPGGETTLALLAEASLLLEDRGWTTPFSTRKHESGTVWHANGEIDVRALPGPGLLRRATLARSGVMAGARPHVAPIPGGLGQGRTGSVPSILREAESAPDSTTPVLIAGGVLALAAVAAVAFLAFGGSSAPEPPAEVAPASDARPAATPRQAHPLLRKASDLAKDGDFAGAAHAWIELEATAPAEASAAKEALLPLLRERLPAETVARARAALGTSGMPDAATRKRVAEGLAESKSLARRLGAKASDTEAAALAEIETTLELMAKADESVPVCQVARIRWIQTGESDRAVTSSAEPGEAPALAGLLGRPHASLRLAIRPFRAFDRPEAPVFEHEVRAADISPGKALAVIHPEHRMLLLLELGANRRLSLIRRTPKGAPDSFRLLTGPEPALLTLTDPANGESASILLFTGPPPAPLRLPSDLPGERAGEVTLPGWLAAVASRVSAPGAHPALLPRGFNGAPRDFPGLNASRSVVEQALRARLAADERSGAAEAARLTKALAALPQNLREAGAPWSICIAPPGADATLALIRFDKP